MTYICEADLVAEVCNSALDVWGPEAKVHPEVACHGQAHMDILVDAGSELIAVEAKLSHWSRVLAQAYLHRYCVDRTYVAIPEGMVTDSRLREAEHLDVGVLAVSNEGVRIAVEGDRISPRGGNVSRLAAYVS